MNGKLVLLRNSITAWREKASAAIIANFHNVWSLIIFGIHLFNIIYIPLVIGWNCQFTTPSWLSFAFGSDVILLLNACLMCAKAYTDQYGNLVTDPRHICKYYFFQNYGIYELLGSLPIDQLLLVVTDRSEHCNALPNITYLSSVTEGRNTAIFAFSIIRIIRFIAMIKLFKLFDEYDIPGMHISYSRLVKNMLSFLWIAHVDACVFWAICYNEDSDAAWINSFGIGVKDGEILPFAYQFLDNYLETQKSMFFSFREVNTSIEKVYSLIELIAGALINGSIFGNITNLIQSMDRNAALDKKAEKHIFRMDYLKRYMKQKQFQPKLQKSVQQHNEFEWIRLKGMDEDKLFGALPKSLRQEVCNHLYMDLLSSMPLFKDCDLAFKASVARVMRMITVQQDFYVFRQHDDGQEMYFIRSGSVNVILSDGKIICTLKSGSFFGEIALFEACRRTASVKTTIMTELCVLRKEDFDQILLIYPRVAEALRKSIEEKKQADQKRKDDEANAKALALAKAQNASRRHGHRSRSRKSRNDD